MVALVVVLSCCAFTLAVVVAAQALRIQEIRRRAEVMMANADRTNKMLIGLWQTAPPEKMIEAFGTTINKILGGQPMQVVDNVKDAKEEEGPYYPYVEFDEWLGAEGMPTAAGWWSPPRNDENSENAS